MHALLLIDFSRKPLKISNQRDTIVGQQMTYLGCIGDILLHIK
jgi:hypothetical protein